MNKRLYTLMTMEKTVVPTGNFLVFEAFPCPFFITDENGIVKSFDSFSDAEEEANDCQDGHIILL